MVDLCLLESFFPLAVSYQLVMHSFNCVASSGEMKVYRVCLCGFLSVEGAVQVGFGFHAGQAPFPFVLCAELPAGGERNGFVVRLQSSGTLGNCWDGVMVLN